MFLSFSINIFGINQGYDDWFINYQKDSDQLVTNSIVCADEVEGGGWMLVRDADVQDGQSDACSGLVPYLSKIGIQARGHMLLRGVLKPFGMASSHLYIVFAHVVVALLSAITLALFCHWVLRRWGAMEGYVTAALIANSTWIVGYAKSLYWALPLMILPMLLMLFGIKQDMSSRRVIILGLLLYLCFCVKFAAGYEYVPVVILSAIAAAVVALVLAKATLNVILRCSIFVGVIGLCAFLSILVAHTLLLVNDVGSLAAAKNIIAGRVVDRTVGGEAYKKYVYAGLEATVPSASPILAYYLPLERYRKDLPNVPTGTVSIANYALLPLISVPVQIKQPMDTYISSLLASLFVFILTARSYLKALFTAGAASIQRFREESALTIGILIGLVSILSWYFLAYAHSLVHAHINGITFYLPYGLFLYVLIAVKLSPVLRRTKI